MTPIRHAHCKIIWLASLGAAFIATHLPPRALPSHLPLRDALLHFLGYCALGLATIWRLENRPVALASRQWLGWLAFLIFYAIVDELSQPLVGRSSEMGDWLADVCGAIIGMTAAQRLLRRPATGL